MLKWSFSVFECRNFLPHNWQMYGKLLVWSSLCLFKLAWCANDLAHTSQVCVFIPKWMVFLWFRSPLWLLKFWPHKSHRCCSKFLHNFWCTLNVATFFNLLPQSGHTMESASVCTFAMCFSNMDSFSTLKRQPSC